MQTIQLPSGPIRYRESGQGKAIVFVHGLLVSGALWEPVMAHMPAGVRCIAPDWPLGSHTEPMNEDADLTPEGVAAIVAEFLEAMDLSDVTLVGNDSGGAICQVVMTRHPGRVGRVVLTTCDAFDVFPPKLFEYLGLLVKMPFLVPVVAKLLAAVPVLRRLETTYGLVTRTPIDDALLDAWIAPGARDARIRRDLLKFIAGVSPRVTEEAATHFGAVKIPVLVAWTPEDPSFPMRLAEKLVATLPRATLSTIDRSYVFSALDRPERVAELVGAFVSDTAAT
jgi:pimeloyl-ACP methyl ester carboxylesterase